MANRSVKNLRQRSSGVQIKLLQVTTYHGQLLYWHNLIENPVGQQHFCIFVKLDPSTHQSMLQLSTNEPADSDLSGSKIHVAPPGP